MSKHIYLIILILFIKFFDNKAFNSEKDFDEVIQNDNSAISYKQPMTYNYSLEMAKDLFQSQVNFEDYIAQHNGHWFSYNNKERYEFTVDLIGINESIPMVFRFHYMNIFESQSQSSENFVNGRGKIILCCNVCNINQSRVDDISLNQSVFGYLTYSYHPNIENKHPYFIIQSLHYTLKDRNTWIPEYLVRAFITMVKKHTKHLHIMMRSDVTKLKVKTSILNEFRFSQQFPGVKYINLNKFQYELRKLAFALDYNLDNWNFVKRHLMKKLVLQGYEHIPDVHNFFDHNLKPGLVIKPYNHSQLRRSIIRRQELLARHAAYRAAKMLARTVQQSNDHGQPTPTPPSCYVPDGVEKILL